MTYSLNLEQDLKVKNIRIAGVTRVDVHRLGALVPEGLRDPGGDKEGRKAWVAQHDDALLNTLEGTATAHGGDFSSFAEWTTMCGVLYDFGDINSKRRERFKDPYRAAISTVFGVNLESGLGALIQATAFVPDRGVDFEMTAWQPEALYDTEFMALAPAVTVRFGGARQVYLSGVMDWDNDHVQLHTDDARQQIRSVLLRIINSMTEAGGDANDVVRLRPILPTADCLPILQEELSSLWKGAIPPVVTPIAGLPMPKGQFAEIQAYGMVSDQHPVTHEVLEGVGRRARARDFEVIQAGPFSGSAAEGARSVKAFLSAQKLASADLANMLVFCRTPADGRDFAEMAAIDPACLHLIPARPENPLAGGRILVELTAVKG